MNLALIPKLEAFPPGACNSCQAAQRARAARTQHSAEFMARVATLSPRERQIILSIARGLAPAQMSAEMKISPKTVSTYRARLLEKLGLKNNVDIALACERAGLLDEQF